MYLQISNLVSFNKFLWQTNRAVINTKYNCFALTELQEGLRLTLEGAQAAFISHDRLVVSLKTGELYVLSLLADSMRSVRGFHFDKAAASVLTTCVSEGFTMLEIT